MATNRCMNSGCMAAAPAGEWRKGWALRAGGFAILCDKCGLAYDQHVFCDIFHQKESGWRECSYCGKRLHCGCIASRNSFDLLDSGGVQCLNCIKASGVQFIPTQPVPKLLPPPQMHQSQRPFPLSARGPSEEVFQGRAIDMPSVSMDKWEEKPILPLNRISSLIGTSSQNIFDLKDIHIENNCSNNNNNSNTNSEPLTETSLSMSLGLANTPNMERTIMLPPPELTGQRPRHFVPKPSKAMPFDTTKDLSQLSHMRVARPPAEGRGRNQLLPRYWPRITDQELQQISGDSNATIVPLFEKVLSASDAGRIGRLVLPKACAEAYFPPISLPEGRPLTIQDAKGKEWHFQFRFWPNNNSRMYVLEGVTPCIQSLQLQAGDTVTFSRIEPGGKLVMGFRKASNTATLPDSQISAIANGTFMADPFFTQGDNLQIVSGYSGFLHPRKGPPDHTNPSDGDVGWLNKSGRPLPNEILQPFQKRTCNIGLKSRRLSMDSKEALELKLTWEEAQDLLRPPPTVKPNVVLIEEYEFEEYDEPPIFGKKTIFTARASGDQDQWIQCDECFKWRRLTINVIVASKWTCPDNTCDSKYSSCSAPDELSPKEIQNLLQQYEEIKRQRNGGYNYKQNITELDASGLDALATAATVGDSTNGIQATPSVAPTTKHPRHRPGCTCIVCIQPPSGKGPKHNPSCTCNVCLTVRRRFKTLMMRKKQKQSEREKAEASNNKKLLWAASKDEAEGSNTSRGTPLAVLDVHRESESANLGLDINRAGIDLNFYPDLQSRPSMMNLLEVANRPLESYLKLNGFASLAGEPGGSSSTVTVPMALAESEERTSNDGVPVASVNREQETGLEEGGDNNANQEKVASEAV
ncbi:B3 domain-containing protein Os07g0679700-like isoform X2 [Carex rostrata]